MKLQATGKCLYLSLSLSTVSVLGKYPYLSVKTSAARDKNGALTVNFGNVPIGTVVEKNMEIHNMTPVNVHVLMLIYCNVCVTIGTSLILIRT